MKKPHITLVKRSNPAVWLCKAPGKLVGIGNDPKGAYVAWIWANMRATGVEDERPERLA